MITRILLALLVFLSAAGLTLKAQPETAAKVEKYQAQTHQDPKVPVSELKLMLAPLRMKKLEAEVEAWLDVLEKKVDEISQAEIQQSRLKKEDPGKSEEELKKQREERTKLLEKLSELRNERTALVDRVNVVLAAFKAKGGTAVEHELFVSGVSAALPVDLSDFDVTDTAGLWIKIRGWLVSTDGGLRWAKNIALFIVTLIVFVFLGRFLGKVTGRAIGGFKKTSDLLRDFFVNSVRKVTVFVGFVVALSMLEVNIGPFLAAIGAASFVVAFALQGTLSNFASGVMILLYRPYDIGDAVQVSGVSGSVDAMTLVSTTIRSWDNQRVVVPNNKIWGDVITNITGNDTRRVDMVFGISYGTTWTRRRASWKRSWPATRRC